MTAIAAASVVDRLAAHRTLGVAPRAELEWLAAQGRMMRAEPGELITTTGAPVDFLYVTLTGRVVFYSERGGNRRRIFEWGAGDLGGVLPYSRLRTSPGIAVVEEAADFLTVPKSVFPELIAQCPAITAACVHAMLDRARLFTRSDLHDEKMASLGKLAAGLAHELNNPASAAARSARLLGTMLDEAEAAAAPLALLDERQANALARARAAAQEVSVAPQRGALEQSDREEEIREWLEAHDADDDLAAELARTPLGLEALDALAADMTGKPLAIALRWLAATSAVRSLTGEIEHAAVRIYDLVSAIRRFTYMDRATVPEPIHVWRSIRDTVSVLAAKARSRSVTVDVDIPGDLPPVLGYGGELNQVWSNLLDNALDAAASRVHITAHCTGHLVSVAIVDDGPGIPEDLRGRIFEPFFTTKPIGQGTGLGLDIVRRILQRQEGDVSVSSRPGRTEFCVTLPRATESPNP